MASARRVEGAASAGVAREMEAREAEYLAGKLLLGWRFRIRMYSVEGRIRADSG